MPIRVLGGPSKLQVVWDASVSSDESLQIDDDDEPVHDDEVIAVDNDSTELHDDESLST